MKKRIIAVISSVIATAAMFASCSESGASRKTTASVSSGSAASSNHDTTTDSISSATMKNVDFEAASKTVYTNANVALLSVPSASGRIKMFIKPNEAVTVTSASTDGTWYAVSYEGIEGYIPTSGAANTNSAVKIESSDNTVREHQDYNELASNSEQELITLTQQFRTTNGMSQFIVDPKLNEAARIRAKELAKKFAHFRPDRQVGLSAIEEVGANYRNRAENIVMETRTVDGTTLYNSFEGSTGHKETMLKTDYTSVGIGVYYDPDTGYSYACQLFGGISD